MALNVLVVDDSSVMRSIIKKTLKLCGLPIGEIYEAGDGFEGLKVLDSHWIDLASVDINMPTMNGEEMIDRVRQNPDLTDLSIIVVSTESSETRIDNLIAKGAQFIHKPFTPEVLKEKILNIVGGVDEQQDGEESLHDSDLDF